MLDQVQFFETPPHLQNPYIETTLTLSDWQSATLDVCGLGFVMVYVNGQRAEEGYFRPNWTDYRKRDFSTLLYPTNDELSHTIEVLHYDITHLLHKGENTLSFLLGNGWYRQTGREIEGKNSYSDRLLLAFEVAVHSASGDTQYFRSDETLTACEGPVLRNNIYLGETQDYDYMPKLFGGKGSPAYPLQKTQRPQAEYVYATSPGDAVMRTLRPKLLRQTGKVRLYDMGENISGWLTARSTGEDVQIRYAERCTPDLQLDFSGTGGDQQIQQHVYLHFPAGKSLSPRFSWAAFRYAEVTGEVEDLVAQVVHTKLAQTAEFSCSDPVLQWLSDAYMRTQLNNMHAGVPSDCPHRERLGYTGDGQLTANLAMLLWDARDFYRKWMRDIVDSQDIHSGHIQHTAPFYGGGGGPGGWGCAVMAIPYDYYCRYGDISLFEEYRAQILHWFDSMEGFSEGELVVREREGGWCLGDWCMPNDHTVAEPLVNTFYYIRSLQQFDELEKICARSPRFSQAIEKKKQALRKTYGDEKRPYACIFLAALQLVDAPTEAALLQHYRETLCFDTGIFGTAVLGEWLRHRDPALLYDLLTSTKFPSFGFMKNAGATTLWEYWDGRESQNHPMFGACLQEIYFGLLGIDINQCDRSIRVQPLLERGDMQARLRGNFGELTVRVRQGKYSVDYKGDFALQN